MFIHLLRQLCLNPRDLRPSDVLKTVDHIGRRDPRLLLRIRFWVEVHQLSCKICRHIVSYPIVERIDADLALPLFCFKAQVKIKRFLRLQIGIAEPVITELPDADIVRHTGIHLPVIVEFPHPRLRISRTDIRLEPPVGISSERMCQPHVKADMRTE